MEKESKVVTKLDNLKGRWGQKKNKSDNNNKEPLVKLDINNPENTLDEQVLQNSFKSTNKRDLGLLSNEKYDPFDDIILLFCCDNREPKTFLYLNHSTGLIARRRMTERGLNSFLEEHITIFIIPRFPKPSIYMNKHYTAESYPNCAQPGKDFNSTKQMFEQLTEWKLLNKLKPFTEKNMVNTNGLLYVFKSSERVHVADTYGFLADLSNNVVDALVASSCLIASSDDSLIPEKLHFKILKHRKIAWDLFLKISYFRCDNYINDTKIMVSSPSFVLNDILDRQLHMMMNHPGHCDYIIVWCEEKLKHARSMLDWHKSIMECKEKGEFICPEYPDRVSENLSMDETLDSRIVSAAFIEVKAKGSVSLSELLRFVNKIAKDSGRGNEFTGPELIDILSPPLEYDSDDLKFKMPSPTK